MMAKRLADEGRKSRRKRSACDSARCTVPRGPVDVGVDAVERNKTGLTLGVLAEPIDVAFSAH